jgi:hypothetical protein
LRPNLNGRFGNFLDNISGAERGQVLKGRIWLFNRLAAKVRTLATRLTSIVLILMELKLRFISIANRGFTITIFGRTGGPRAATSFAPNRMNYSPVISDDRFTQHDPVQSKTLIFICAESHI